MRLFIALNLEELNTHIDSFKEHINEKGVSLSVGTHLTLKFLGDVNEEHKENVCSALKTISFSEFSLTTTEIGFFPNDKNPKVVWVGVKDSEPLKKLQADIENSLSSFGFPKDFNFHPHITIGRIKFLEHKELFLSRVRELETEQKTVNVKNFHLIKSILTPEVPKYSVVKTFPFS